MKKIVVLVLSSIAVLTASLVNVASAQRSETTIVECDDPGLLNNIAQITADSDVDVDSTPSNDPIDTGSNEDDVAQDCTNIMALVDLELEKEISANETLDGICTGAADNPRKSDEFCLGTGPNYTGGDPSMIFCGDTIVYTVTLSNEGPSTASNPIVVEDYLPGSQQLSNIILTAPMGDDVSRAMRTVTWNVLSDLDAGDSTTLEIKGEVGC